MIFTPAAVSARDFKNDGVSWIKKKSTGASTGPGAGAASGSAGASTSGDGPPVLDREDYVLHKSGVLCSFKAVSTCNVSAAMQCAGNRIPCLVC